MLSKAVSQLHRTLNEVRKGVFCLGEEADLGDLSIEDVLADVEDAVAVAEAGSL